MNNLSNLIKAVKDNDIDQVNKMIKRGIDINMTDSDGKTGLHYACMYFTYYAIKNDSLAYYWNIYRYNKKYILDKLLDTDININIQDNDGNTPLHIACITSNYYAVNRLLNFNTNMKILNNSNETPFQIVCSKKNDSNILYHTNYSIALLLVENRAHINENLIQYIEIAKLNENHLIVKLLENL
jgi:ankyrin repeat protein